MSLMIIKEDLFNCCCLVAFLNIKLIRNFKKFKNERKKAIQS